MLRVTASTSSDGAKRYFGEGLTRSDYYMDGQEVAGLWGGKGAERLGLSGQVDGERYFALCDNQNPSNGQQLTPRLKENRRVGYDWTFSAPKAVSVLYEMSGDERILGAFQNSYRETLNDAESEMKTRVRSGGKNEDRLTRNAVWAEFSHFTARPVNGQPSPHLHAHCFLFNTTYDEAEKRWKASQQGDLKRDADYWEAAFHTRFAKRLNDLGYATVKKGTSFTLADLPQSITDKFSERRNEIERKAAEMGIADAVGKHAIGYYGREHKTLDQGKTELRAEWASRLSSEEREALNNVAAGGGSRARTIAPAEAMTYSLDHSFERVSAISEKRLKADTLERLLIDEKLQKQTRGQVLWVDEAGMISSRSMQRLFEVARKQECRVILSGDYRQHASIEAGDSFRLLESEAGVRLAELKKIRRQNDPQYRKVVEEISRGTALGAKKGFDRLDRMGAIIEATSDERHKLLVADYLQAASDGKSALIIAPTRAEGKRLTEELRDALKERGALGAEREFTVRRPTYWTDAEKQDARNFEPGMVVEFHQATSGERHRANGKRETTGGFERGAKAVVIAGGETVWLQREDGTRTVLPAQQASRFQVFVTDKLKIAEGDRISITKNGQAQVGDTGKGIRINNGDTFTVEGFTKRGDIRLSDGKVLDKRYCHLDFGYVDTSYAAQGKTVDRVFIATGNESLAAAGKQQWYVSVSRGREACKVYVDSKDDVRDAIAKKGERTSAVELMSGQPKERQSIYATLMERNRLWRFVKERAAAIAESVRNRAQRHTPQREGIGHGR